MLTACGCCLPCPRFLAQRPSHSLWAGASQTPGWSWASCSGQLLTKLCCGFFSQYYEMSYGLNIEMHKQVSAVGAGPAAGECGEEARVGDFVGK